MDPRPKLLIAESRDFSPAALETLRPYFALDLADVDREHLLKRVHDCDYLWVRLRTFIDAEILDRAPALKGVVTNTTGLNHIDLDACKERGIQIVSLQGESEFLKSVRATAEHTLGLGLALLRHIPAAHHHVCAGYWDRTSFSGREIYGKTVGIIGYGRLGKIVARYFRALEANVIVHDRALSPNQVVDGFSSKPLSELLAASDIVSLHVAYEPANRYMLGASQFRAMKPGAIFINTARGELVDELALVDALESGQLAGAALDVLDSEHAPTPARDHLIRFAGQTDRLILTPHIGGNTIESTRRTELFLAEKVCLMQGVYSTDALKK